MSVHVHREEAGGAGSYVPSERYILRPRIDGSSVGLDVGKQRRALVRGCGQEVTPEALTADVEGARRASHSRSPPRSRWPHRGALL